MFRHSVRLFDCSHAVLFTLIECVYWQVSADAIRHAEMTEKRIILEFAMDVVASTIARLSFPSLVPEEGIERTLATNHLGSFLLTGLLLDKLLAQDHPVRIVFLNTNIIGRKCELDFDDLNAESRKKYDGFEVYKQSKLAAAMFARELSERLKGTNVSVTVADPGRTKSNLSKQMDGQTFFLSRWLLRIVSFGMGERRVEKAVRPVLYALADPAMEGANGVFIDRERKEQPWCDPVEDAEKRRRLWNTSEVWTKLGDKDESNANRAWRSSGVYAKNA
ncbi:hypothetical protein Q1695_008774 [Nippostrongylus brasiliensis]|nr:hypothetical protein Q1695_008774 [Nippostrongylus brasiliensis]